MALFRELDELSKDLRGIITAKDLETYFKNDSTCRVGNFLAIVHLWNGGQDDRLYLEDFVGGLTPHGAAVGSSRAFA